MSEPINIASVYNYQDHQVVELLIQLFTQENNQILDIAHTMLMLGTPQRASSPTTITHQF